MGAIRECLKCGFANKQATGDTNEECPQCSAIYSRVALQMAKAAATSSGSVKAAPGNPGTAATIIAAIIVYILFRSCSSDTPSPTPATPPAAPTTAASTNSSAASAAPIRVTASELFDAYNANEISADMEYRGRALIVSGAIQSIDAGLTGGAIVSLATINEFMPVRASGLRPGLAATLRKGQSLTVLCIGEGATGGSPWLADCTID
jgi:hypothetical protein